MKLSDDIIFTLDHSYPEIATILPIVNAMSRNGYSVKANFRHSHDDNQYYFRLNLYSKGSFHPLVAFRFFLEKDFDPSTDVYASFCDANFDEFSLYFSTNKDCNELKLAVFEKNTLPVDVIPVPGHQNFQAKELATYLVCFREPSLCFELFSPILNKIINSDGGIVTAQLNTSKNNKRPSLRLYFDDYGSNSFSKAPIRISGNLSEKIPFDSQMLPNITFYSQQNYPIKLEIETFGGNSGPLLRFRVFAK